VGQIRYCSDKEEAVKYKNEALDEIRDIAVVHPNEAIPTRYQNEATDYSNESLFTEKVVAAVCSRHNEH
jgi:hypothetical protein